MYPSPLRKRRRLSRPSRQDPILPTHQTYQPTDRASSAMWSSLAPELLVNVFNHLTSPSDRRSVMLVCRSWKEAVNAKSLWKESVVCIKRLPLPQCWCILESRRIRRFVVRGNVATAVQILLKLNEHSPELISLQIETTENLDFLQRTCNEFLESVTKFSKLKTLGLVGNGSQNFQSIEVLLRGLPNLEELRFSNASLIRVSTQKQSAHEKLLMLHLQRITALTCTDVTALINLFPNMERLRIQACTFEGTFLNASAAKKKGYCPIRELSLANTMFDGEEVKLPFRFKFLESFDLTSCRQSEEQLTHLVKQLENLKEFQLSGNDCTDAVLQKLFSPLKSLELKHCISVSERGVRELAEVCGDSLVSLNLAHCSQMNVSVLKSLPRLFPSLSQLDLSGWTTLTATALEPLQNAKSLKKLVLASANNSQALRQTLYTIFRKTGDKIIIVC